MLSSSFNSLWGLLGGSSQTEKKELFFAEEEPQKKPHSPGSDSPRRTLTGKYYFYDVEHCFNNEKSNVILCIGTDGIFLLNPSNEIEERRFDLKYIKNVSFNPAAGHWEFRYGSMMTSFELHIFVSRDAKKMQEAAINTFESLLKSKPKDDQPSTGGARSGPISPTPKIVPQKSKSAEITKPVPFRSVPDMKVEHVVPKIDPYLIQKASSESQLKGDDWTPRTVDSPTILTRSRAPSTATDHPITPKADHSLFQTESELSLSNSIQNNPTNGPHTSLITKNQDQNHLENHDNSDPKTDLVQCEFCLEMVKKDDQDHDRTCSSATLFHSGTPRIIL